MSASAFWIHILYVMGKVSSPETPCIVLTFNFYRQSLQFVRFNFPFKWENVAYGLLLKLLLLDLLLSHVVKDNQYSQYFQALSYNSKEPLSFTGCNSPISEFLPCSRLNYLGLIYIHPIRSQSCCCKPILFVYYNADYRGHVFKSAVN